MSTAVTPLRVRADKCQMRPQRLQYSRGRALNAIKPA